MKRSIAIGLGCAAVLVAISTAPGDYAPFPKIGGHFIGAT